jgi:hypothetical protein
MSAWAAAGDNLLSPMVLAFALGLVATLIKSDLRLPEDLYNGLALYLLLAIGLKGGVALAATPGAALFAPALAALALGVTIPLWCYAALRRLGGLGVADAAAVAAHYGSVSAVTFVASVNFLERLGAAPEGFMPALVALLEVPGIVVALLIARRAMGHGGTWSEVLHELLTGKSIVLLVGGLIIGWLCGPARYARVAPLFTELFPGALVLFLLELGMLTGRRWRDAAHAGGFLLAFGLLAPVLNGALGACAGALAGLSVAGSAVLATLAASASYIAAPAAVRIALPEANPSLYLTAALVVTFPFNLTIGLPVYHAFARWAVAALAPGALP